MANVGPLTTEIGLPVWGTPAHFNMFRVLAALLHGTLVTGVRQICGVEQRAPPIFGRAAITLGIGPHSSLLYIALENENQFDLIVYARMIATSVDFTCLASSRLRLRTKVPTNSKYRRRFYFMTYFYAAISTIVSGVL